ncbi:MAG TPA: SRPBCC domain-containing protein [Glaciihabitans sp.]|jgi:uncharacterized protein YndB with AHSA1/START domain|nr:SRPBCC domain-containing protein [Glaciihabitans sp.]
MNNTTGTSKDDGWSVGVRHTVAAPLDEVWSFLLGKGLSIWLGNARMTFEKGAKYKTDDDIFGHIISVSDKSRVRMTWQPGEWHHDSTLHVTVKKSESGGTVIGFQQERLADRDERKIMLTHWKEVLERLDEALSKAARRP